jgi:hypothetical protein
VTTRWLASLAACVSLAPTAAGAAGGTAPTPRSHRVLVRSGAVAVELAYRETDGDVDRVQLVIRRAGVVKLDASLGQVNCARCPSDGPNLFAASAARSLLVRDLDADGEPEVLLGLYTGGAHCCFYSLVLRYRPSDGVYRRFTAFWGNPGARIADLDRDGRPELVTGDDRFSYRFAAFAYSVQPLLVWHYDHGRLIDATSAFPGLVAREAYALWRSYLADRGHGPSADVRGVLAAYLADEYRLGRGDEGWRRLEQALQRGELHPYGRDDDFWPTDRAYLRKLRAFLQQTGYAR